jgi:hypothetical protein
LDYVVLAILSQKPSGQLLDLIVMNYWLGDVWIRIRGISIVLPLFFFLLENCVCLSRGVQLLGAVWRVTMMIVAGVGDLMQRIGNDRTGQVLGGRMIERSGDAVCSLHRVRVDEEHMFLGWASKQMSTVCEWFGLEITRIVFFGFASKLVARVSWFEPQNWQFRFGDLSLKITVTVSWF